MRPNEIADFAKANPFADFSGIVSGERFIGRARPLTEIYQKIITSTYPGCISIVGQRRIGKSSLAWHSLLQQRISLHQRRLLPVWVNLGECRVPHEFFALLLRQVQQCLAEIGFYNPLLERTYRGALKACGSWLEFNSEFTNYFIQLHELEWKAIFVLDEFDTARTLFRDEPQAFQTIRGLADRPDSKVCFVTTSRRALYEIERKADPNSSTLSGIFHKIKLTCFSIIEVAELLERLNAIQLSPTPRLVEFFVENCGGHPYLTNTLAFHFARSWIDSGLEDLEAPLQSAQAEFVEHYDELKDLLKEDDSLHKLLEIVFGPVVDATINDAARLEQAGLIRPSADGYYEGFSINFTDYLRSIHRSCDLWPLWTQTERALRDFVHGKMTAIYCNSDWTDSVIAERPTLHETVVEWRAVRSRERLAVGRRASDLLIDYALSQDLWRIMKSYRKVFLPVLGHDEKYWEVAFDVLFAARNRMAHGRDVHVDTAVRSHAAEYCNELIEIIHRWQRSSPTPEE